jgi:hypothetical protein
VSVMICRECGEQFALRSRFEGCCPECGSEDLESQDAYDPSEHELQCEFCGYKVDTSAGPDKDWESDAVPEPRSVDDPCPICTSALVPTSEAASVRAQPESKLAREAARKVHREHEVEGPPYNVETLAQKLGLEVVRGNFEHDGMLVGERIEAPDGLSSAVERYLIAHEIGHHVLRHEGERSKLEPEANAFASELLIPRGELTAAIARNPSVRALRERFAVSKQALAIAVMRAGAIDKVRS